jgi:ArsR family transcriptional regulator
MSRVMLSVARANLERDGVSNAQVRYGDIFSLPVESGAADAVCVHHVLHFLAEPGAAVKEAARLLKRDGLLIISDFAPHDLEFLREEHAHRRLGFSDEEVAGWCAASGVKLVDSAALPPKKDAAQGLTVKIWLGKANGTVRQMSKNRRAA